MSIYQSQTRNVNGESRAVAVSFFRKQSMFPSFYYRAAMLLFISERESTKCDFALGDSVVGGAVLPLYRGRENYYYVNRKRWRRRRQWWRWWRWLRWRRIEAKMVVVIRKKDYISRRRIQIEGTLVNTGST